MSGMGGIGKTTIATTLFERLRDPATGSCFVPDVSSSISGPCGIERLQGKMLKDLAYQDGTPVDPQEGKLFASTCTCRSIGVLALLLRLPSETLRYRVTMGSCAGRNKLRFWLGDTKVLLVLDDVEDGNVHELVGSLAGPIGLGAQWHMCSATPRSAKSRSAVAFGSVGISRGPT